MAQRSHNQSVTPPQQSTRRKLIMTLTGAGGAAVIAKSLPDSWTAPVVESVSLPVHAQLSTANGVFGDNGFFGSRIEPASLPLDMLVNRAYAGGINTDTPLDICFQVEDGIVTFLYVEFNQTMHTLPALGLPKPITEPITLDTSGPTEVSSGVVDFTGPANSHLGGIVTLDDGGAVQFPFSAGLGACSEVGP